MSADLLIRDVPDDVIAAIDAKAKRLGLSRTQYLRRTLAREAASDERRVTAADLVWFSDTFADLADEEVMRRAWE
ncbi:ribbon-helix-helix protein, CopG family [Nocardia huaxiensis]|uniref:Ribbon-helix-helix protein, CopG family n=1 Tax=Nocardia huaxiensis TaxID=2755382 RepID=A0A7D6ZBJ3_9NOCA|nr:ribbon-helix-helix protein, CopG family [Nocardia huaxiensis]QLY31588.1 ribbon-helix-helix protein, CopG family [Nocardia huaxiensis]UFS95142.1 ribbon-helix-helix protein, CopG family [Nocardia huaxiensis]